MSHNDDAVEARPLSRPIGPAAFLDSLILAVTRKLLRRVTKGRVRLTLPSGRGGAFGPGCDAEGAAGGVDATLDVKSFAVFWRAMRRASIGLGESYMAGEFDTRDLGDLFRFYLDNRTHLEAAGKGLFSVGLRDRIAHRMRANTRTGSRRNIRAHYDLGNDFYSAWLDRGMTYSSALYEDAADSLEAAQERKIAAVLAALGAAPGASILEIGCGWGSFAEAAARAGMKVTGLTLSDEQARYARDRLARAGLSGSTDIRFEDYRDNDGRYDHVVSIEMIEAVGEENWPRYFEAIHRRLVPGGTGVIQSITIDPAQYARYRRKPDFIQAYIFPGGMLPTVEAMRRNAEAAGLGFETVTEFGSSYAATLAEWRMRFERAWPAIAALGFDERFRRMWLYYLVYCEVGFERGAIEVGLYRVSRPAVGAA